MMNPTARLARAKAVGRRAAVGSAQGFAGASAAGGAAPGAGAVPGVPAAPAKPKFHPYRVLNNLPESGLLSPQQLRAAAHAYSVLETRPAIHGYKQLATQLGQEKASDAKGLGALGERLQGGVSDVYKNIATSEAQSLARQQAMGQSLNAQSAQIGQEATAGLAKTQEGQLGDLTKGLEMRGAPGGGAAQQELAQAVASQQANQATSNQADQSLALNQGGAFSGLQAGLAGAAQLQGGAAVGGIGREALSRVGQSNQKYNENIGTALGKLADAKATRGATFVKNLTELNEGNRKFKLGEQAVNSEKAKLSAEEKQNAANNKINQEKAEASLTSAAASAKNAAVANYKAHNPAASSGELAKRQKEIKQETAEVQTLIPTLVGTYGSPFKAPKNVSLGKALAAFTLKLNEKASADPALVQKIVNEWAKVRTQGNRGAPGAKKVPFK